MDRRFPTRESCVLEPLLRRQAEDRSDQIFVTFEDGAIWTYAETYLQACQAAASLQSLGVVRGDSVLSWLPNGPDALRVWFGANFAGAIFTPLNLAYRGRLLEHVIANSGASIIVLHAELAHRLSEIELGSLTRAVVIGDSQVSIQNLQAVPSDALVCAGEFRSLGEPVEPWDDYGILYTSGTTGPSKGVLSTYIQLYEGVRAAFLGCGVTEHDNYMLQLPLFHLGGIIGTYAMAVAGGSLTMVSAFDTSSFWRVVTRRQITVCTLLGSMATFLEKQMPTPHDEANPLRLVYMVPMVPHVTQFEARFHVEVRTMFSMTEVPPPIISERGTNAPGSCGRLRAGIEARIVDEHDRELPHGEAGELILRSDLPWAISRGYHQMPDASAAAWRNGWFHTGDALLRDEAGNFFFVDRVKDSIRRRGENISSFELEAEVLAQPDVRDAAAIAVPSDSLEDEVMIVVSAQPGRRLDPLELLQFLSPRVAHFMLPRYVRIVPNLPKTPTAKIRKHELRDQGITADTFDREAAGFVTKRERIGEISKEGASG